MTKNNKLLQWCYSYCV